MKTPYIKIDISKIQHNARTIVNQCKEYGVSVTGVTKGTLGMPEVAQAMIRGGVEWIGESRLDNIEGLRKSNIHVPILLMRSPHMSEIERVVSVADYSLNSEYEVIRALSEASLKKGTIHKIIIMVDLGDLREGVWPDELIPLVKEIISMRGIQIVGLGTNLTDLNGTIPTYENNKQLVDLVEEVEDKFMIKLQYLSGGNSSSFKLLSSGKLPDRINHFRIGEGILLGRETVGRELWHGTYQDAFTLCAEIIEKKSKPSLPVGEIGQDAFGNTPTIEDRGIMTRAILNMGRQDTNIDGLIPSQSKIKVIGATSDHTLVDMTQIPDKNIGDIVSFDLNYAALLTSMTSPFVRKVIL
ncbi:alanine/ornithine racemase family PLP-dependent enzyme [Alkaliphilus peptidifermentans]|uniref:Predicted amino acid racemase n=1 Tax=Alkaliphilus peptidifermentans DSM 18978 TaxID=1120976 RepID=A0A1G5G305_9FIRM|nr:alanine/ornithine racemase family PLP-dependent enzyme [Alkaliphilus peptidifermentans]SCY45801.1 Predicted amino acid racemase [Alkaliphilus peptidifermentans DSM 18978]